MKRKILVLVWLITLLLAQPPAALTQGANTPTTDGWEVVKATSVEDELEVVRRDGRKVRGRLLTVSDTTLRLSRKDEVIDLGKADIFRIYRSTPKSGEFHRLTSGIGATVGGGVGLAVALSTNRRSYGRGPSAAIVLIPVGTALGAIGGYILGSKMKSRMLIYESK